MDNNGFAALLAGLIYIAVWVICAALYIVNIFKIVSWSSPEMNVEFVLRVLGVFVPPLGSIMGVV